MLNQIRNVIKDNPIDENKRKSLESHAQRTSQRAFTNVSPALDVDGAGATNANFELITHAASVAATKAVGAIAPVLQGLVPRVGLQAPASPPPAHPATQWVDALAANIEEYPGSGTEKLNAVEYKPAPSDMKGGKCCFGDAIAAEV